MQGTFEPPDHHMEDDMHGESDEDTDPARNRKSRLGAISNVPWNEQLKPSNDRATQRRMVDHREREARYNTLNPKP